MVELEKKLIVIVGPTAVGKTSLSIALANEFNCPIISTDSRQFYKEMTIGTAKPTTEELRQAEHHFIDNKTIQDRYTAGMFEMDAIARLNKIFQNHNYCIAVGGSGLYINALCYGIDDIPSDDKIRDELYKRWQNEGLEKLQKELQAADPEYFEQADVQNPRRVMRALEAYQITGKKYSELRKNANKNRSFKTIWIGLELPLDELYERINSRVDVMVENGLLKEVKALYPYKDLKALKTVGYQEIMDHLDGEISLEKSIELVKRNSRRFARKQYSWFRRNKEIKWFKPDDYESIMKYVNHK